MLKLMLSQISLDRMNAREWQKNLIILRVLMKLLLDASELHSPFWGVDLRMGIQTCNQGCAS